MKKPSVRKKSAVTSIVGTSGWRIFDPESKFYPKSVASAEQLAYFSKRIEAVEINSTFYHFSRESTYAKWRDSTAPGFTIAIKANQEFTHTHPLKDPNKRLDEFLETARTLGPQLGPVLFQFPGSFERNVTLLKKFVDKLPDDLRFVFELRNETWNQPSVSKILEKKGIATCVFDIKQKTSPEIITADFMYARLHGPDQRPYRGSYSAESLAAWAERIKRWNTRGLDSYVFFDNTMTIAAVENVFDLVKLAGVR